MEGSIFYEEAKRKRLEENKKRLQELGLADLSKSLKSSFNTGKSPQSRQAKSRAMKQTFDFEPRRSSRVANNPKPDYREVEVDASLGRRSCSRSYLLARKYASHEARMDAADRAVTIMKGLPSDNASFVKPMLQSHVSGCFWLGLPVMFCKTYLPKQDDRMTLEDEDGQEWETVYLANKTGLSGGWRGFSLDHGLIDGDALVFELVEPLRFKVHIVRAYEDGASDDDHCTGETPQEADITKNKREAVLAVKAGKKENIMEEEENSEEKAINKKCEGIKGSKKRLKMEDGEEEITEEKMPNREEKEQPAATMKASNRAEITEKKHESDGHVGTRKRRPKRVAIKGAMIEADGEKQQLLQITSFLPAKKPGASKASKKSIMASAEVISVC